MKIGVFDSGVGGLSVLKSLLDSGLFSEIIYYGDTARVPYGNKDKGTIVRFSLEAVEFFAPHKIDMLIVACNTVSAHALDKMQEIAPFPIIGVVESGVLSLSNKIKNKKDSILIIATKATIESGIYEKNLRALGYENLISLQTGLFVPLVEEGILEGEILEATFRYYFGNLNNLRVRATESRPIRGAKNRIQTSSSASADFLLESDKRGSPPKSEKRQLLARRGSGVGGAALLRKEIGESNAKSMDCFGDEPPRNDESLGCHDSAFAKSTHESPQDEFATPNAIILGCTHFPLIANQIRAYFDNKPILIHSGEAIVEFLKQKYTLSSSHKLPKVHFYASGDKSTLESYAKLWLNS